MSEEALLQRLAAQDTNTVSDALDLLGLSGATAGVRPQWNCPPIVGRAITVEMAPKTDDSVQQHPVTGVIDAAGRAGTVMVVANGGRMDVSGWGDIVSNACQVRGVAGAVIDGVCRDIVGSETIGFPVFARGVVPISARIRSIQKSGMEPVMFGGVRVRPGDYVIADRCGTVFVAAEHIEAVIDLAEKTAERQAGMIRAIRRGGSVAVAMHDREFEAVKEMK